jgi:intermembrane space import and assembly protein 40
MQDCFRQHPDVYGAELEDDDEDNEIEEEIRVREAPQNAETPEKLSSEPAKVEEHAEKASPSTPNEKPPRDTQKVKLHEDPEGGEAADDLLPKAVHDATSK